MKKKNENQIVVMSNGYNGYGVGEIIDSFPAGHKRKALACLEREAGANGSQAYATLAGQPWPAAHE